ncbi:MAG: iron-containing redox enzyme family protein [Bdellovibrio sp.]
MEWNHLFEETMKEIKVQAEAFPWEDEVAYSQWLGQTYHFVIHSTRLLALASARTPMSQYQFHNRFIDHAKEERGHEKMLINDLKALGRDLSQIPEFACTSALYKTQYYYIEHCSTDTFMGWVIMLEAFASNFGPGILKRVTKAHGKDASVFWKVHAEEDQDHIQKAFKQVSQLPDSHQAETILNFQHTANHYLNILKECAAVAKKVKLAA